MALFDLTPASNNGGYDFIQSTTPVPTDVNQRWYDTSTKISWVINPYPGGGGEPYYESENLAYASYKFSLAANTNSEWLLVPYPYVGKSAPYSGVIMQAVISLNAMTVNHTNTIYNTLGLNVCNHNELSTSLWTPRTSAVNTTIAGNTIDTKLCTIANLPYSRILGNFNIASLSAIRIINVSTGAAGTIQGYLNLITKFSSGGNPFI